MRLQSLDVLRGLTVVAMILVNAASVLSGAYPEVRVFPTLLHAQWSGCTLADLVFPFFMFVVGVSISFALGGARRDRGLTGTLMLKVGRRAVVLFAIGVALSAVVTLAEGERRILVLGVLQRIGVAYFFAALIFVGSGARVQAAVAVGLLLAYAAVVAWVPVPGVGAPDVAVPGRNFSSWLDPALLGADLVLRKDVPFPYDPEGLLGTLMACVPQALIGAAVGEWLKRPRPRGERAAKLALAGLGMASLGWLWSFSLPFVKSIWTSSYVLFTTGVAMILLAALHLVLDDGRRSHGHWVRFGEGFGVNALTAYVLHTFFLGFEVSPLAWMSYRALDGVLPGKIASLGPILVVLLLTWLPIRWLYRRGTVLTV